MAEPVSTTVIAVAGLSWVAGAVAGGALGNASDRVYQSVLRAVKDRVAGLRGLPENEDVARAVRTAQIQALERLIQDYRQAGPPEWESKAYTRPEMFFERSSNFCRRTIGRCFDPSVKLNLDVTEPLTAAIDGILALPVQDGPADNRAKAIASFAEEAVLNELSSELDGVALPDGFETHFREGSADKPRFLDLFGAFIVEQFKLKERFRAIFTTGLLSEIKALSFDSAEMLARIETRFAIVLGGIADTTGKISAVQDKHGTLLVEILRVVDAPREAHAPAEMDFPPPIATLMQEGLKLLKEGHYAQARQAYAMASQKAEEHSCTSAAVEARIRIAETQLLEDRNIAAARDSLQSYLSEAPNPKTRQKILGLLGNVEIRLGNIQEAQSLYREARQFSKQCGDRSSEALHLLGFSHAEELLGHLETAHRVVEEATELFRAEHREAKGEEKISAAVNIGAALANKAILFRHEGKLADAVACLARAELLFKEANSRDNLGRTLLLKGELLLNEAKRDQGFSAIQDAFATFESLGNIVWQCRCLDDMARFYYQYDNETAALGCLGRAIRLARSAQLEIQAIPTLLRFAQLLGDHNHLDEAMGIVLEAKQFAAITSADDWIAAQCLIAEAQLLKGGDAEDARGQLFRAAIAHLESALAGCEVKGRRAEYMQRIGEIYGWLREARDARHWFEMALREHEEIGDVVGTCDALAGLASVAREENAPAESIAILERLIIFCEGRPLHFHRASALHDLGMLMLSQGDVNAAKNRLEAAKALAEKHNFRNILDALNHSMERLGDAQRFHEPPHSDLPSLIRELHEWCDLHPKLRSAIIPVWYYLHRAELWSIVRSKLGVKFLVYTKSPTTFRRVSEFLKRQGDLFIWGTTFTLKTKRKTDLIPMPEKFLIPPHLKIAGFKKIPRDPKDTWKALVNALHDEQYILVPFDAAVGASRGTQLWIFGRYLRLPVMISKMMLDTPANDLIADRRICLPLGEGDKPANLLHVLLVAWENGAVPVFSESLPHSDEVRSACDVTLDLPGHVEVAREHWVKLLLSCAEAPGPSLSEFVSQMAALVSSGRGTELLRVRVYMLRFRAGSRDVIHPAVITSPR